MKNISPSEFTIQGTMKAYGSSAAGTYGGVTKELKESVTVWMKFEKLSGNTGPTQAQMMSDDTWRATMYYNPAFTTNWLLEYEGQVYQINSCKADDPAYKKFNILEVSTSITQTSWS